MVLGSFLDHPVAPTISHDRSFGYPVLVLGGLPIAVMNREQSARVLDEAGSAARATDRPPIYVTSANGEVLSRVAGSSLVEALFSAADLIHADGQAMVLMSRLGRLPLPERVATTDLFHDVARCAEASGTSFYFLGGTADTMARALVAVQAAYPKLVVAGARNGYFSEAEEAEVVGDIVRAKPGILWIGMGVPREQAFVVRNRVRLTGVGAVKTCGGLFDFLSGRRSRAPVWMQVAGIEWLYRVMLEPHRLLWRYLTTNPHALYLIARSLLASNGTMPARRSRATLTGH